MDGPMSGLSELIGNKPHFSGLLGNKPAFLGKLDVPTLARA